jgi:hypothetical protein
VKAHGTVGRSTETRAALLAFANNSLGGKSYPLRVQVYIVALGIGEVVCCALDEGDGSRLIVTEEDVQQSSATNDANQVLMSGAVGKISNKHGALIVKRDTRGKTSLVDVIVIVWWAFEAERSGFAIASGSLE